nr:hypothetical protein [Bacteroidota bacterium]
MYQLINTDMIGTRVEEWGGEEMVSQIIQMLEDGYNSSIGKIETAVNSRDFKSIKELVHPIKSNFYYFIDKTSPFGLKIQKLEDKGRDEDESELDEFLEYFRLHAEQTLSELKEFTKDF